MPMPIVLNNIVLNQLTETVTLL